MTGLALCASVIQAPAAPGAAFLSRLDDLGDAGAWYVSNFAVKRDSFRTAWKSGSVTRPVSGGTLLSLVPAPEESHKDFFGAEVQRKQRTHFGRYEVVMTAARGYGVISSFFTYTGPFFGDTHEEIDFEFLGRDTTKVWLNRFVDGQKLPGRWTELGFDAAEAPHLYALDWLPDRLVWSVDGRELLRITSADTEIPQIPQRIYLSIWGGAAAQDTWSGEAPDDTRAHVTYHCLSYRPPGTDAAMCSDALEASHD
ncbi:glycoside hydrolase family 16 [Salipiger aestuarii]|nr:glycoside hydrolase family 16 [Salipiger aestuarii]